LSVQENAPVVILQFNPRYDYNDQKQLDNGCFKELLLGDVHSTHSFSTSTLKDLDFPEGHQQIKHKKLQRLLD
jgi:hypothetical protein